MNTTKTAFVILAIAAAVSLVLAPSLLTSASAIQHTACNGPGSSCSPGNTQSSNHQCKATGSGKCVPGQG